jgi:hypothetical protein
MACRVDGWKRVRQNGDGPEVSEVVGGGCKTLRHTRTVLRLCVPVPVDQPSQPHSLPPRPTPAAPPSRIRTRRPTLTALQPHSLPPARPQLLRLCVPVPVDQPSQPSPRPTPAAPSSRTRTRRPTLTASQPHSLPPARPQRLRPRGPAPVDQPLQPHSLTALQPYSLTASQPSKASETTGGGEHAGPYAPQGVPTGRQSCP